LLPERDAVWQRVDQLTARQEQTARNVDQLTAGQEQVAREITKLQVNKSILYKNSEPPAPRPLPRPSSYARTAR